MSRVQGKRSPTAGKQTLELLGLNVAGIALYLWLASAAWIEPELADVPGASGGGAIVWFFSAVPVFLAFLLANLWMGIVSLADRFKGRSWPFAWYLWLVLPAWLCAVLFDFSRHGI